jgi:hypothetical protein
MQEVIFNTLADASTLQERDYQILLSRIQNPKARQETTAWAEPRQQINGKWAYPVLQGADYSGHNIQNYNVNNYVNET